MEEIVIKMGLVVAYAWERMGRCLSGGNSEKIRYDGCICMRDNGKKFKWGKKITLVTVSMKISVSKRRDWARQRFMILLSLIPSGKRGSSQCRRWWWAGHLEQCHWPSNFEEDEMELLERNRNHGETGRVWRVTVQAAQIVTGWEGWGWWVWHIVMGLEDDKTGSNLTFSIRVNTRNKV